eukprot:gene10161-7115_t
MLVLLEIVYSTRYCSFFLSNPSSYRMFRLLSSLFVLFCFLVLYERSLTPCSEYEMKPGNSHEMKASVSVCFCVGKEVWASGKDGSLRAYDAFSGDPIADVKFSPKKDEDKFSDGPTHRILRGFAMVYHHLWATTVSGDILVFDVDARKEIERIRGPLGSAANKQAALTGISFDGWTVLVGSEAGLVLVMHPTRRRVEVQFRLPEPCTAVCHAQRRAVAGDRTGRIYVFDLDKLRCLGKNTSASSSITCLVHDPASDIVWGGCKDGNLYGYAVRADGVAPKVIVKGLGEATSLTEVTGSILVTTADRYLAVLDGATGNVLHRTRAPHSTSIRGATRVRRQEQAIFWTYDTHSVAREWHITGGVVAGGDDTKQSSAYLPEGQRFSSGSSPVLQDHRYINIPMESERIQKVAAREAMRELIDEVQELRLKLVSIHDTIQCKDMEIDKRKRAEEELKEDNAKLKKEISELTSSLNVSRSECSSLQASLNTCRDDLSKARAESNNAQEEKSKLQMEMSNVRTEKVHVEQQLMDAQSTVLGLRAEMERLFRSIGTLSGAREKEKEIQQKVVATEAETAATVLEYKKLNRLLTSILATMEYTIRRKEEEEQDLTCLLNAFRHRVVDHMSDPHLTALLNATVVRNPARFSYSCDSAVLAQLQDRSAPLQEFLQSLQRSDPDAYKKLIAYLQQSSSMTLAPDGKKALDTFIHLAVKETEFTDESMASFRRSIPLLFVSDSKDTPAAPPGVVSASQVAGTTATSTIDIARKAKTEEEITLRILQNFHSQVSLETETMQQEQKTFEFILTTRRGLVDQLVHLFHRLTMAQMACETLTAASAGGPQACPAVASPAGGLDPKTASNNSQLITSITGELLGVVGHLVRSYLTTAEKQRLGVALTFNEIPRAVEAERSLDMVYDTPFHDNLQFIRVRLGERLRAGITSLSFSCTMTKTNCHQPAPPAPRRILMVDKCNESMPTTAAHLNWSSNKDERIMSRVGSSGSGSDDSGSSDSDSSDKPEEDSADEDITTSVALPPLLLATADEDSSAARGFFAAASSFNMDRTHRRRRLVSQRQLGDGEPAEHFFLRRTALSDDDAALLMSFSNAEIFYKLLRTLQKDRAEADAPIDRLLSRVNPYFHYLCGLRVDASSLVPPSEEALAAVSQQESRFVREVVRPESSGTVHRCVAAPAGNSQRGAKGPSGESRVSRSGAAGVMQKSLQSWERHLEAELQREGETLENFRRNTSKESYMEKQQFRDQATWNEYARELELQEQQKKIEERKRKRDRL